MRQLDKLLRKQGRHQSAAAILKDESGNSMVSVIVGFVLLLMIMAMLQQVVNYSYRMLGKANEVREQTDTLCQEYYTDKQDKTTRAAVMTQELLLVNEEQNTDSFTIELAVNKQMMDDVALYYFGEHQLITEAEVEP